MRIIRSFHVLIAILLAALVHSAPARAAHDVVFFNGYPVGTIVIHTSERRLYYVVGMGTAWRYPVGVGRAGQAWAGRSYIERKDIQPPWSPPPDIKRENPRLPDIIPGGAPNNPMGAAAMGLRGGEYAIHGTNNRASVGSFVSHGCIRMYNEDVLELFARVPTGTTVVVLH
ncbi:MAG TPA: L,D-transpeptidase [Pseudolabrys sp.]|nr:L,D-transpeptidase [Pseudolabrys sp.]